MVTRLPSPRPLLLVSAVLTLAVIGRAEAAQEYTVKVHPDLTRLDISTCFETAVPRRLSASDQRAGQFLLGIRTGEQARWQALTVSGNRLPLAGVSRGDCIEYQVDLSGMDARIPWRRGRPLEGNRLIDPGLWLWLPDDIPKQPLQIRFELPDGVAVSAPWTPVTGRGRGSVYRVPDRPRAWEARVALGHLDRFDIEVSGATLRVALLQGRQPVNRDGVRRWLSAGAQALTKLYGRFPVTSPQVVVVASGPAREPVPWGEVMRGGGDAVHLYIDQTRPLQEFLDDWTLTHELSHLLHPRIGQDDAWLYEGLASYYQNVLRARAGLLDPLTAWDKLNAGFQRGIDGTPKAQTLAEVSRDMHRSHRFMRVYWSGAAIALMADENLRQQTGGRESLDTALDKFQACCLPSDHKWSGWEFLGKLDELTGSRVFRELYEQHVHSTRFPDLRNTYRLLGLETHGSGVRLRDDAPQSAVRRAIMGVDEKL